MPRTGPGHRYRLRARVPLAALTSVALSAALIAGSLTSVTPQGASATVPVSISGTGFNAIASANEVRFTHPNGTVRTAPGETVSAANATGRRTLTLRVPAGLPVGLVALRVRNTATNELSSGISLEILQITLPQTTSAARGSTGTAVRITGSPNARFVAGATVVSFRAGIVVKSVSVESATSLVAVIDVAATASLGSSNVQVKTSTQTALAASAFQVTDGTPANGAPVSRPGGPYSASVGQVVTFDGRASTDPDGDPLTYGWEFGDGGTAAGATPTHTYASSGSFTVRLTVSDGRGGSNAATTTVTINGPPLANPGGPYQAQTGQSITFNGGQSSDPDGDALTFSWNFGDGSTGSGPTPAHAYNAVGQFPVTLTVSDGRGGSHTAVTTANVTRPNRIPTANPGGPYNGKTGVAMVFDGAASTDPDGDSLTYAWEFGGGATGIGAAPAHIYSAPGTFVVRLTVSDGNGGSHSATSIAAVNAPVAGNKPPEAHPGGPYNAPAGTAVAFTGIASIDPDQDPLTYTWDFGDGTTGTGVTPTHVYAAPGTYNITLTVADGKGGVSAAGTTAGISAVAPGNGSPTARAGGPYSGRVGRALTFDGTASTDPDGDALTYEWHFGDGGRGTGASPAHSYAEPGLYAIVLSISDSRGGVHSVRTSAIISGGPASNTPPVSRPGGPYSALEGKAIAFSGIASSDADGDPLTYSWRFGDGGSSSDASPVHAFAMAGEYLVTLIVDDGKGGVHAATTTATITAAPPNRVPLASAGGPYNGQVALAIAFDGTASADPDGDHLTYRWDFGDGTTAAGPSPSHAYATAGAFNVTLRVSDVRGGSSEATTTAAVNAVAAPGTPANKPPTADPGGPYNTQTGQAVALSGSASTDLDGDTLTYTWTFGDGTSGSGATPSHTYSGPGTYSVTLTVSDGRGGVHSAGTVAAVVAVAPGNASPTARPAGPYSGRVATTVAFNGSTSSDPDGDALTYAWNFGDGTVGQGPSPSHTYAAAGLYEVVLTVMDGRGGVHAATTATTISSGPAANRAPVARPGGPYTEFAGAPLLFSGSGSTDPDADALTYTWRFGDGGGALGASPSHTFAQAGKYLVTLIVEDGRGGVHAATAEASIEPRPGNRPPVANAGGPYSTRAAIQLVFDGSLSTDPDADTLSYEWDFGNGVKATGKVAKHVFTEAGAFSVRLTVTDGNGGTSEATAGVTVEAAADQMPPVIQLLGPREALPGTQVTMTARVTDNVKVEDVRFEVAAGSASTVSAPPYVRVVDIPAVTAPGDVVLVTATARDPSANTASAEASIRIVASPDTTAPAVILSAPPSIGRGATLHVSATVNDAVGIAEVVFEIDGQTIPVALGATPRATFQIATDRPLDASVPVSVRAVDHAGNRGDAAATVLIVSDPDVVAPVIALTAPTEIASGAVLPMTATASDSGGVAAVDFLVEGIVVHTATKAPYSAEYAVPSSFAPGSVLRLRAIATDFSGNEAQAHATTVVIATEQLGRSLVSGEVYDDTTGLPLAGATVAIAGTGTDGKPYNGSTVSDARGRFAVPARAGPVTVIISKDNWTRSVREATLAPDTATEVFDARLSPIAAATGTVAPVLGGVIAAPAGELTLAAGALPGNADLRLTPVGQQGIAGLLPVGWSPVAAVDVSPWNVAFVGTQPLQFAAKTGLPPGTVIAAARFDEVQRAWRAVALGAVASDGSLPAVQVPGGGQYAWLAADSAPSAPPDAVVGGALTGAARALLPASATTLINPQPRIIFYKPGVFSDVGTRSADSGPLASGTHVQATITESYRFFAGTRQNPDPFTQDLVLFQVSDGTGVIEAKHRVTPSLTFEAAALELGIITVEVAGATGAARTTPLIAEDGGTVAAPTGEQLRLPPGAGGDGTTFNLQPLTAAQLGITLPQGIEFAGAASISFAGQLTRSATLSIARPSGILDASGILLTRLQTIAGEDRLVLVAMARLAGDRLESDTTLGGDPRAFDGIRVAGRYVFVRPQSAFGFVTGRVLDATGAVFAGALVTTPALPIVAISSPVRYIAVGGVGAVPLTALDLLRSDIGTGQASVPAPRGVGAADLQLAAVAPAVVSITPTNDAQNVPLASPVVVRFSRPIDQGTVASAIRLADPNNAAVAGSFVWALNGTTLTFRPTVALLPNKTYTLTVSTGLRDITGRALATAVSSRFESLDTNPPPVPPAGSINASFPDANGKTSVRGTQGTAGRNDSVTIFNLTRGTSSPVVLDPDGGFLTLADASISDKLRVRIVDAAGNEIAVDLPRFWQVNPDGSVSAFVGSEGGRIDGPNGTAVDVPNGAFPEGTKMTIRYVSEAEFPIELTDEDRQMFRYSGGLNLDFDGATPQIYLNLSLPTQATDGPQDQWIVGQVMVAEGHTLFNMVDRARIINGRVATSSPPCPGVLAHGTYAFVKSTRPVGVSSYKVALRTTAISAVATARLTNLMVAGATSRAFGSQGLVGNMTSVAIMGIVAGMASAFQSYDVCLPSLTGRASITPNVVRLTVPENQRRAADRQVTVKNAATGETRTFPIDVANLSVEVPLVRPDWYEVVADQFGVPLQDMGSTGPNRRRDAAFTVTEGTEGTTLVTVQGDALLLKPEKLVVSQVFQRLKGSGSDLGEQGVEFTVNGSTSDVFEVYSTSPCCAHIGSDLLSITSGGPGSVRIRVLPALATGFNPLTTDFEIKHVTTKQLEAPGPLRFTTEGIPGDGITVDITEATGQLRRVSPQIQPSAAGPHRLVLKVVKATIDPPGVPLEVGSNVTRARGGVRLAGVGGATVPEDLIIDGGIEGWSFPGQLGSNYALHIDYLQDGAPAPARGVTELIATTTITLRNLETGLVWKTIERPTPPRDEPVYLGYLSEDSDPPSLLTPDSELKALDPLQGITVRFSESMDARSLKNGFVVRDKFGNVVKGEVRISDQNRVVTFVPASGLGLGATYTITIQANDASGNMLPATQTTRTATVFAPTMLSSVAVDTDGAPLQMLQDVTLTGQTISGADALFAVGVTRGARTVPGRQFPFQLLTFNVTDPASPTAVGAARGGSFGHSANWRVHVVKGVDERLYDPVVVPSGYPTDPPRIHFKGDLAVVSRASAEVSLLQFYDITNITQPRSLDEKYLTANPDVLINADNRWGAHSIAGYVRGLTSLQTNQGLMLYAAVQDTGLMAVKFGRHVRTPPPLERVKAPLVTGNYFDVVAIRGRLAAVNNDTQQLDLLNPDLSLLGSVSLGQPGHSVVAVPGYGFDFDKDGQIESHEKRDLVIVGVKDSILLVDVTSASPVVIGTIEAVTPTHSTLDFNPSRGWLAASVMQNVSGTAVARGALIELGDPRRFGLIDNDNDEVDDRIVWMDPLSESDGTAIQAARFDGRGYLYFSRVLAYEEDYRGRLEQWDLGGAPRIRHLSADVKPASSPAGSLAPSPITVVRPGDEVILNAIAINSGCTSITYIWTIEGASVIGSTVRHLFSAEGRYAPQVTARCDSASSGPTASVSVVVTDTIVVEQVGSNQFAGSTANHLPGGAGSTGNRLGENYVLMGLRDGLVQARAQIFYPPDLEPVIVGGLRRASGTDVGRVEGISTVHNWEVRIAVSPYDMAEINKYTFAFGFDLNGNRQLEVDEIVTETLAQVWAVGSLERLQSLAILETIQKTPFHPTAANLMNAFLDEEPVVGASRSSITISSNDRRLSHVVGAHFDSAGQATIDSWTFSSSSDPARRILQSQDIADYVAQNLGVHGDECTAQTASWLVMADIKTRVRNWDPEKTPTLRVGPYPLTCLQFHPLGPDESLPEGAAKNSHRFDLGAAFGKVGASLTIEGDIKIQDRFMYITNIRLSGRIFDLYDWDLGLGDLLNSSAAVVQAGFGTMGTGGKIFAVEVFIDGILEERVPDLPSQPALIKLSPDPRPPK